MERKLFYSKLNKILDECGEDMPRGGKRRPFLANSWKKYYNKSSINLVDISKFKDIRNLLKSKGKLGMYIGLIFHRMD